MPLQDEYQVSLDAFCGPLDLLLYLIRQAELDVDDIPIARITDQYLQCLERVDEIDVEAAGEFLVMAATLMEIKSRALMPDVEPAAGDEGGPEHGAPPRADPRYELVRQLLEYQRYRIASEALEQRRVEFARRFPALSCRAAGAPPAEHEELSLEDAHALDLADAYRRICLAIDFSQMGDHHVRLDETPAAAYQAQLLERLEAAPGGRLALQALFAGRDRVHRLGLFLAMLELVRLRRVTVTQEDLLAEIVVELLPHGAHQAADAEAS
jgi:segregation and condensation protein A